LPIIPDVQLRDVAERIFRANGSSEEEAIEVADDLVESNLLGVDDHGVAMIPYYVQMIKNPINLLGFTFPAIKPNSSITVVKDSGPIVVMDGGSGYGQVVARRAMRLAIEKAKTFGVGIVAARNSGHIGRLATYPMLAVDENMIGVIVAKNPPVLSPPGASGRILGNNPLCFAFPAQKEKAIVVDLATSVAAAGKILLAMGNEEQIPEGWVIDSDGKATTDPHTLVMGGSQLPFGGHKGFALAIAVEVLGGILTGCELLGTPADYNPFLAMALNIEAFMTVAQFKENVDGLIARIHSAKRTGDVEIRVPGERGFRMKEIRSKEGIPIPDKTWMTLQRLADETLTIDPPIIS
jgi:LDH2 family malate/lactate/ureidoglycolate dehydrogenase